MPVGPVARDGRTAVFFDGTSRGEFLIRRCQHCGAAGEPAIGQCPGCGSADLDWSPASGVATLVSWTVVPGREGGATILAIGQLAEGPWWWAQFADADPAALRTGLPLRITFERDGEHEAVPVFRPA